MVQWKSSVEPLPPQPSLEHQRKLAKQLLRDVWAGDERAIGCIRTFLSDRRVNGDTRVSVVEGKVRATSRSGSQLMLSAGEEADIRLDGSIARPAHPNVSNSIAWRQHRLIFDNATLEEIAVEFNRYNPSVHLRLEGLQGDGHRFDGSFEATDPQSFIEMLAKEPDLAIERREGEVVIRRR